MSRWFRHYAGMMRDEKLVSAAVKSKQPVERVVWVWGAVLESALEIDDAGRFELGADEAAYFLRCAESDIADILAAFVGSGRIRDGVVVKWSDRQFQSDQSKDRQKRYRDRLKSGGDGGSDVTSPSLEPHVTPQEADTEAETENIEPQHPEQMPSRADLEKLEDQLRIAAGLEKSPSPGLFVLAPVLGLLRAGHDLELDVLPTIRALSKRMRRPAQSWDYFTEAIRETSAKRRGIGARGLSPPEASNAGNIFGKIEQELKDGPVRNGGGNGITLDAVRSLPDLRRQEQRDDGQSLPGGDRGLHAARTA